MAPIPFHHVGVNHALITEAAVDHAIKRGARRPGLILFDELALPDAPDRIGSFFYQQWIHRQQLDQPVPPLLLRPDYTWADVSDIIRVGALQQQMVEWYEHYRPDYLIGQTAVFYWLLKAALQRRPDAPYMSMIPELHDRWMPQFDIRNAQVFEHAIHLLDQQIRIRARGLPAVPMRIFIPPCFHDGSGIEPCVG